MSSDGMLLKFVELMPLNNDVVIIVVVVVVAVVTGVLELTTPGVAVPDVGGEVVAVVVNVEVGELVAQAEPSAGSEYSSNGLYPFGNAKLDAAPSLSGEYTSPA